MTAGADVGYNELEQRYKVALAKEQLLRDFSEEVKNENKNADENKLA